LHLERRGDVAKQPTEAELQSLLGLPGLVGQAAQRLQAAIEHEPNGAATAREAMAKLHALVQGGAS
ncbi:MAG: hypothetical protein RL398_1164, partial [Planctomycetota bacterium]